MSGYAFRYRRRRLPTPQQQMAGPTANDQLATAIVAHLAAAKPLMSEEQRSAVLQMLRVRDLGGVSLAGAATLVDEYAAAEMFFDVATFRAAFEKWFSAPKLATASTEEMFDDWRKAREAVDREQRQVDGALAGFGADELRRIRDEIADEIEHRPADRSKRAPVDEQRRDNQTEATTLRKSDPTRPGLARAMVYERVRGAIA